MTAAGRLHTSWYLYRLGLAAAVTAAASAAVLIILGWTLLFGSQLLSPSAFLSIAAGVIPASGVVFILLWTALSYRPSAASPRHP